MECLGMPNQHDAVVSRGPIWRLPTVKLQTGLSTTEIYRRLKKGTFPQPLKLGARAVGWQAATIEAWVQSLVQQGAR